VAKKNERLRRGFGLAVRQARREANLSQEQLAERSALHRVFISEVERGLKAPTLDAIAAIATALGKRPSELLFEGEELRLMGADGPAGSLPEPPSETTGTVRALRQRATD